MFESNTTDGSFLDAVPGYDASGIPFSYQSFQCDDIDALLSDNKLDDIDALLDWFVNANL